MLDLSNLIEAYLFEIKSRGLEKSIMNNDLTYHTDLLRYKERGPFLNEALGAFELNCEE